MQVDDKLKRIEHKTRLPRQNVEWTTQSPSAASETRGRQAFTYRTLAFNIDCEMLTITRFLQLLFMGLYTGILFGDRVGVTPIRPKLPSASFVLYQQQLHLVFGRLMPVLLIGSFLAGIVSLILKRRSYRNTLFLFTVIALICNAAVILLTVLINVPVNETLMTWQVSSPPENVMQLWAPWEGSHTIRTVIALLGFAALVYGYAAGPKINGGANQLPSI
jgi:Domain of unknown function (DUF1772)